MDIPESLNSVLFATKQVGSWENYLSNYAHISTSDSHPLLIEAMTTTIDNRQGAPQFTRVYTDDWTPIEWVTNKIVVDFIRSGDLAFLR
jgi:hypothetical protein